MPPDSVSLTPATASIPADGRLQFTVTTHWPDSHTEDVTHSILTTWTVSDDDVAVVNDGEGIGGLALGVSPGTVTVTVHYVGDLVPTALEDSAVITVTEPAAFEDPVGRVLVAFDWNTLDPDPEWIRLDDHPNLVTSYSIQRGRNHELDHTDSGRATIEIIDPDGVLDTTNPESPAYNTIRPLVQAAIGRRNPVTDEWSLRFRGFVEDFSYTVDPSEQFNRLSITLIDLFELLNACEMQIPQFGEVLPEGIEFDTGGQLWYGENTVEGRLASLLNFYGLAGRFRAVLPGSILTHMTLYSPGTTVMEAITEAVDAEGPPSLSNLYCDRRGRLAFQGRNGRLDPATTAAGVTPDEWDFHDWKAGDGAAITASPEDTVQLRSLEFNRGLASVINSAMAAPVDVEDEQLGGQLVVDSDSIGFYGIRSWSATNLIVHAWLGEVGGSGGAFPDATETRRYAEFIVLNYRDIRDRPTAGFRPLDPEDPRAPVLWDFLNTVDIGDRLQLTVTAGGAGGPVFTPGGSDMFFVEAIQEDVKPLTPDYDDVTLTVTLTAQEYYMHNPWEGLP